MHSGQAWSNAVNADHVFRQRLREERTAQGRTQAELAARASELGAASGVRLHGTSLARIETGSQGVNLEVAGALAAALGVPLPELLAHTERSSAREQLVRAREQLADIEARQRALSAEHHVTSTRIARLRAVVGENDDRGGAPPGDAGASRED